MGETTVKYLGHNEGHMISKLEENLGDTDIKNFTVSPLYQIKCITDSLCHVRDLRLCLFLSPSNQVVALHHHHEEQERLESLQSRESISRSIPRQGLPGRGLGAAVPTTEGQAGAGGGEQKSAACGGTGLVERG